jgi:predicted MPP superfamily phosphohydrolase
MTAGFFVFLTVIIGSWTGMHYYVFRNLAAAGVEQGFLQPALWALALTFPASRILSLRWRNPPVRVLYWIGAAWVGLLFLLCFWFFVSFLARHALIGFGLGTAADPRWWALTVTAAVAAMGAWGLWRARRAPTLVRYVVDRSDRYGAGRELRIVQISDVHLGVTIGIAFLKRLVAAVNALEPDLIVLTGDLFDPEFPDDDIAADLMAGFKAREAVLAVSGNHEFYAGMGRFLKMMARAGIPVLDNEARTVAGVQVAGIHDQTANRFPSAGVKSDLAKALSAIDPALPSLLLAHQPKELDAAVEKNVDLILSGHTHRGQIFPFGAIVRLSYKFLGGRYRLGPRTDLIVSSGTGFWGPPLRIGTESQIVFVTLRH